MVQQHHCGSPSVPRTTHLGAPLRSAKPNSSRKLPSINQESDKEPSSRYLPHIPTPRHSLPPSRTHARPLISDPSPTEPVLVLRPSASRSSVGTESGAGNNPSKEVAAASQHLATADIPAKLSPSHPSADTLTVSATALFSEESAREEASIWRDEVWVEVEDAYNYFADNVAVDCTYDFPDIDEPSVMLVLHRVAALLHARSCNVSSTFGSRVRASRAADACDLPPSLGELRVNYDAEVDDIFISKYRRHARMRMVGKAAETSAVPGENVRSAQLVDSINLHEKRGQAHPNAQREAKKSPSLIDKHKYSEKGNHNPAVTARSARSVAISAKFDKDLTRLFKILKETKGRQRSKMMRATTNCAEKKRCGINEHAKTRPRKLANTAPLSSVGRTTRQEDYQSEYYRKEQDMPSLPIRRTEHRPLQHNAKTHRLQKTVESRNAQLLNSNKLQTKRPGNHVATDCSRSGVREENINSLDGFTLGQFSRYDPSKGVHDVSAAPIVQVPQHGMRGNAVSKKHSHHKLLAQKRVGRTTENQVCNHRNMQPIVKSLPPSNVKRGSKAASSSLRASLAPLSPPAKRQKVMRNPQTGAYSHLSARIKTGTTAARNAQHQSLPPLHDPSGGNKWNHVRIVEPFTGADNISNLREVPCRTADPRRRKTISQTRPAINAPSKTTRTPSSSVRDFKGNPRPNYTHLSLSDLKTSSRKSSGKSNAANVSSESPRAKRSALLHGRRQIGRHQPSATVDGDNFSQVHSGYVDPRNSRSLGAGRFIPGSLLIPNVEEQRLRSNEYATNVRSHDAQAERETDNRCKPRCPGGQRQRERRMSNPREALGGNFEGQHLYAGSARGHKTGRLSHSRKSDADSELHLQSAFSSGDKNVFHAFDARRNQSRVDAQRVEQTVYMYDSGSADDDNSQEYQHELEFSEEHKLKTRKDIELRSYLEYQQRYEEQNARNLANDVQGRNAPNKTRPYKHHHKQMGYTLDGRRHHMEQRSNYPHLSYNP